MVMSMGGYQVSVSSGQEGFRAQDIGYREERVFATEFTEVRSEFLSELPTPPLPYSTTLRTFFRRLIPGYGIRPPGASLFPFHYSTIPPPNYFDPSSQSTTTGLLMASSMS